MEANPGLLQGAWKMWWRRRHNSEVVAVMISICNAITKSRARWADHKMRPDKDDAIKFAHEGVPNEKRPL